MTMSSLESPNSWMTRPDGATSPPFWIWNCTVPNGNTCRTTSRSKVSWYWGGTPNKTLSFMAWYPPGIIFLTEMELNSIAFRHGRTFEQQKRKWERRWLYFEAACRPPEIGIRTCCFGGVLSMWIVSKPLCSMCEQQKHRQYFGRATSADVSQPTTFNQQDLLHEGLMRTGSRNRTKK